MPASKNTSAHKGYLAETRAIHFLSAQNYKLIDRNRKINGVEIDIIMFRDIYYLFEVKSIRSFEEMYFRVSRRQMSRLEYARFSYEDFSQSLVCLKFVFVCADQILLLNQEDLE